MLQTDAFLSASNAAVWNSNLTRFFQVLHNEDYNTRAKLVAFSVTVCLSRCKTNWWLSIFWGKIKSMLRPTLLGLNRNESVCSRENPEFIYNCIPLPSTECRICWMYSCLSTLRVYKASHLLHLTGALLVLTMQSVLQSLRATNRVQLRIHNELLGQFIF